LIETPDVFFVAASEDCESAEVGLFSGAAVSCAMVDMASKAKEKNQQVSNRNETLATE